MRMRSAQKWMGSDESSRARNGGRRAEGDGSSYPVGCIGYSGGWRAYLYTALRKIGVQSVDDVAAVEDFKSAGPDYDPQRGNLEILRSEESGFFAVIWVYE